MRLVLDTNVVASALLWGGKPLQLLQAAREQHITLFSSTAMLAELTDILGRHKFALKITASQFTVNELVDRYANLATLVRPTKVTAIAPDPDDDVVIGTALGANAELIVAGDKPFLAVLEHRGVRIISVREAIRKIYPDLAP